MTLNIMKRDDMIKYNHINIMKGDDMDQIIMNNHKKIKILRILCILSLNLNEKINNSVTSH